MAPVITLTSDFGDSYYVGEMKGVLKRVSPHADIVDITHSVEKYNVVDGAFVLSRIWRHFPKNTVHVAVVDPGVGSTRKGVAVETEQCIMVGPDNGILRWALKDQKILRAVELEFNKVQTLAGMKDLSPTFHGRDLFAPAAALISRGTDIDMLGARVTDLGVLDLREDVIVHVDSFGNIITTLVKNLVPGTRVVVLHGARRYDALVVKTFSDAQPGQLIVLTGSHGLTEVDVNRGNAAERLGARAGDRITVEDAS
jgi:S-adenosyl-L-methionine hydrolase (adenosine-forming)